MIALRWLAAVLFIASVVVFLLLSNVRIAAMEPRAGVAQYDKERQHWTLYTPSQGVFGMRENLRATQILQERMEPIRLYNWDQINTANFIPASFTEAFYSTNANNAANAGDFVYTGTVAVASTCFSTPRRLSPTPVPSVSW